MHYDDDSSAQKLDGLAPLKPVDENATDEGAGDEPLILVPRDLPPLPTRRAEPDLSEPRQIEPPPAVAPYTGVRRTMNYILGLTVWFALNFAVGVIIAVLLHEGELDSLMDLVKALVKWLRS